MKKSKPQLKLISKSISKRSLPHSKYIVSCNTIHEEKGKTSNM